MPTATLTTSPTVSSTPFIPLKVAATAASLPLLASPSSPQQQYTVATLRPLYTRAARAFLHHDIVLTHSLLASAFALLPPPTTNALDSISEHRRKWDVLRITLEVTVYSEPPADTTRVPATLRSNALLSGAALLATLHSRSVRLFAPADSPTPNPAYLPSQVLVTLGLSSAKIGCPAAGRGIIEEWLACRIPAGVPEEGYERVLEVYCLSLLPALGEWTYAREFLQYETELPDQSRGRIVASLTSLHEQYLASLVQKPKVDPPPPSTPTPPTSSSHPPSSAVTPTPSRPSSPTPSSSSASTNSTHTAVPANPHRRGAKYHSHSLGPLTPTPSTSTVTPASYRASFRAASSSPARRSRTPAAAAAAGERYAGSALTRSGAGALSSWFDALRPYIRLAPLFMLCVVLPALAVLVRFFRRRHKATATVVAAAASAGAEVGAGAVRNKAVEDVRRRLSGVQGGRGLLSAVWDETVRALWDTVVMGGRGLV
ncbi:hypothetical protein EI94DRAFT_1659481 [Lactarius quietus]|nr:hypothetical protein EI94DRAFT_1659481 [Lactarius quietus]